MDWLQRLTDELADPSWAAGMLETLVGAAVAVGAALVILRYQLKHDRDLAMQQRRAAAATHYGRQLLAAHDVLMQTSPFDFGPLLRAGGEAPAAGLINRAVKESSTELGRHELGWLLWWHRLYLWSSARDALGDLRTEHVSEAERDARVGSAVLRLLLENNQILACVAGELIRWDGRGELPGATCAGESFVPVPARDAPNDAFETWCREARDNFRRIYGEVAALRDQLPEQL